jgi:hypothetical protein
MTNKKLARRTIAVIVLLFGLTLGAGSFLDDCNFIGHDELMRECKDNNTLLRLAGLGLIIPSVLFLAYSFGAHKIILDSPPTAQSTELTEKAKAQQRLKKVKGMLDTGEIGEDRYHALRKKIIDNYKAELSQNI